MSAVGTCDEGRVRFAVSYRNTVDLEASPTGRRVRLARYLPMGAHGPAYYYARSEQDAGAARAWMAAEVAEWHAWCDRRGWPYGAEHYDLERVVVDVERWHELYYGAPMTERDRECVLADIARVETVAQ